MARLVAVLIVALHVSLSAQRTLTSEVDAIYSDIETLYKDLHQNPELGFQETQTAAKLAARMKALGFDVTTGVGKTGVVAIMKNGAGPTVMLRTELDALPVAEKTGLRLCQHRHHEERRRTARAGHARVRTRHSHVGVGRNGAAHGRAQGSLARHADDGRPAGGRRAGRRGRHADRRSVHALSPPRLRAVAPRRRHDAGGDDRLPRRSVPRDVGSRGDHRLRPRRTCGDAAQRRRSRRPRLAHRPRAADDRLSREQPERSGRDHRRVDPRRHAGQHHSRRSEAGVVGADVHDPGAHADARRDPSHRERRSRIGRRPARASRHRAGDRQAAGRQRSCPHLTSRWLR